MNGTQSSSTAVPASSPATSSGRWESLVVLSAAVAVASFLVCEVYDLDVFWNVTIGKDIIARQEVPSVDRYTRAGLGHSYVDIHWLFQVAAAAFQMSLGWPGVQLLTCLIWGATLVLVGRVAARHANTAVAALLVFLAAMASVERFLPRPEIATFLCLAIFIDRFDAQAYRTWRQVLLLCMTQVLWANAHGLFVLGPFVSCCYLLDSALSLLRGRPAPSLVRLAGLTVLLCVMSVLTPHGLGTWSYAWLLVTQVGPDATSLMKSLGELSPTFGEAFRHSPAFWFYVVLLALSGLAIVDGFSRRALSASRFLVLAGLGAASMSGRRNVVLLAVGAAPFVAEHLIVLHRYFKRWPRPACAALSLLLLAWCWYPLSGRYYLAMELPARFGLGVTPSFFPHGLEAYLDRIGYSGQVFNSNTIGGYYMFSGFPNRMPLTEGRWTAYDEETVTRILQAPKNPALWTWVLRTFGVDALLLHHTSPEAHELLPMLRTPAPWRLVWLDHSSSFWLRSDILPQVPSIDLTASLNLPSARRVDDAMILEAFLMRLEAHEARIENLREAAGFGWRRDMFLERLGQVQLESGKTHNAEDTFNVLAREFPDNVVALNELAYFSLLRGDFATAEKHLERAIALDPSNRDARANLERIRAGRAR